MTILLSCLQSSRAHHIPAYGFWRKYFVDGLREAGFELAEVPDVDWAEGLALCEKEVLQAWKAQTWERLLEFARGQQDRQPITIFLSYLFPKQVDVSAIQELKRMGIPCVNFFCDNVREFRRVPDEFKPFDLHWVPEHEALEMYERAKLSYLNAPMPCWIAPKFRSPPEAETEPPTFIGSSDVLRRNLFARALNLGADVVLRGPGWSPSPNTSAATRPVIRSLKATAQHQVDIIRSQGISGFCRKIENRIFPLKSAKIPEDAVRPTVTDDEYFRITREAIITLGVNRVPTLGASNRRPLRYSRLRDVEAPMLGACYLTEHTDGLDKLYAIGEQIETYRTPEELAHKIEALRNDPARRRQMRQSAQRQALTEHNIARTTGRILERLGLRP